MKVQDICEGAWCLLELAVLHAGFSIVASGYLDFELDESGCRIVAVDAPLVHVLRDQMEREQPARYHFFAGWALLLERAGLATLNPDGAGWEGITVRPTAAGERFARLRSQDRLMLDTEIAA